MRQVEQHLPYVSLEPQAGGRYLIRTAAALPTHRAGRAHGALRGGGLPGAGAARRAVRGGAELLLRSTAISPRMREPLKYSFRLTLTLVLLLAMLAAIYGAIYSAQRLVRPVQDLIEGTRAVGKGDFATRLPLPSRDEMGFLVHSFNDMTKRLRRARAEATHSQQAVERERERLAIILARLSTGVLAIDRNLTVRIANEAAGAILGTRSVGGHRADAAGARRAATSGSGSSSPRSRCASPPGARSGASSSISTAPAGAARSCAPARRCPGRTADVGFVIVFDDITALLQAQRDAAWGEVARRLAHEIKNPLTPIQLSAERLRRRLLAGMSERDAEILERGTRTIVQQVRDHAADGERLQRVRARAGDADHALQPQSAGDRGGRSVPLAGPAHAASAWSSTSSSRAIEADRGRVRQILNNLVTNALEALDGVGAPKLEITHAAGEQRPMPSTPS